MTHVKKLVRDASGFFLKLLLQNISPYWDTLRLKIDARFYENYQLHKRSCSGDPGYTQ